IHRKEQREQLARKAIGGGVAGRYPFVLRPYRSGRDGRRDHCGGGIAVEPRKGVMTSRIKTEIAATTETAITVRGRDLVGELMGKYSFTEFVYFLICHRFPTAGETRVLDTCLVTIAEHGLTPSSIVTRLIADSVPDETQVAIAAGLLAVGSVFVGTMEGCGEILKRGVAQGGDLHAYCREIV